MSNILVSLYIIINICVCFVSGWRVVFKVGQGRSDFPGTTVYEFWNSNHTFNDDRASYMMTQDTYSQMDYPSYKSAIVNAWSYENRKIQMTKIGMYDNGAEVAYVLFNATFMNKLSWFSKNQIIASSFTDLSPTNIQNCSIAGAANYKFVISDYSNPSCGTVSGWMMVIDGQAGSCHWEYGHPIPSFRYSGTQKAEAYTNTSVAEAFAIFVDDCVENPCNYGGVCHLSATGSYTCTCPDQTYGRSCEIECPCHRGLCRVVGPQDQVTAAGVFINGTFINNKTVELQDNTVIACLCSTGYEGRICEANVDDCARSPCQNGGFCIDGDSAYACDCPNGFSGRHCEDIDNPQAENMAVGAKVAIGVCVPLLIIMIALAVGYGIYIYKNPERFGRSTTYKQYVMARDFVRRSFRRLSGRRTKPPKKLSEDVTARDDKQISPKETEAGLEHVNLGFQDNEVNLGKITGTGSKNPVYTRENSEFFELSANDEAVVTGPEKYEMTRQKGMISDNQYPRSNENNPRGKRGPRGGGRPDYDREQSDHIPENSRDPPSYETEFRHDSTNRMGKFDYPSTIDANDSRGLSNPLPEPHYNTGYINEPHRNPVRPSYDRYADEPRQYGRRGQYSDRHRNYSNENSREDSRQYSSRNDADDYRYGDDSYEQQYEPRSPRQDAYSNQDAIVFASTEPIDEVTV